MAVTFYLPDYVANAMATFRSSRSWTWFYANWGYEESDCHRRGNAERKQGECKAPG